MQRLIIDTDPGQDDAVAILLASINIVGGFAVTRRMLAMFTKGPAS